MDAKMIEKIAKSIVSSDNGIKAWYNRDANPHGDSYLYCWSLLGLSELPEERVIEDELVQKYNAFKFPEKAQFKCLSKKGKAVFCTFEFHYVDDDEVKSLARRHMMEIFDDSIIGEMP